jgi:hypothetical protein
VPFFLFLGGVACRHAAHGCRGEWIDTKTTLPALNFDVVQSGNTKKVLAFDRI